MDKSHGLNIPEFWFKVGVGLVHVASIPLTHPHEANDQVVVGDVVSTCCFQNWRCVKVAS